MERSAIRVFVSGAGKSRISLRSMRATDLPLRAISPHAALRLGCVNAAAPSPPFRYNTRKSFPNQEEEHP
jgi:hypothetical protein